MKKNVSQNDSMVEVEGLEAKYYDFLMNAISFGTYGNFIKRATDDLQLQYGDSIMDFGCGTGRNACIMLKYIGNTGKIIGLDIGREMIDNFKKNCKQDNVRIEEKRIDEVLTGYDKQFDTVFISFVLHGFIQEKRDIIIENALRVLKDTGRFAILDYNNFNIDNSSLITKFLIRKLECPLAEDFINRDWKKILSNKGFSAFEEYFYFKNKIRLLIAKK